MRRRLIGLCALLFIVLAASTKCEAQRLPERDPRARSDDADSLVSDAIKRNQADPQTTRVAEATLRSLIRWERGVGLKFGPAQLEKFISGRGGDVVYGPSSQVAKWTREHEGAQYSHRAAHENATNRIRKWLEQEVRGGRTSFPASITLESIGFVKNYVDKNSPGYKDRLQGPTLYQSGLVFKVPLPYLEAPKSVVELIISFGDMQGPHEGVISNLKVEVVEKDGKRIAQFKYDVTYTWNDQYTFNNDKDMGEYDRAAHYLEFMAKTAKSYKTSVIMQEQVSGSFDITDAESDPSDGQNPGGQNPGGQNPGGQNPGGPNPGGPNPGGPNPGGDSGAGDPNSPNPGSPNPGGGGDQGAGGGGAAGPGKGGVKLPPMNIPHPPGWGVKLK